MDCSYLRINVEATMWYFNIRMWFDNFSLSSHALKVEHCLNKAFKRSVQCFYHHFPLTFYRWHSHRPSLVCWQWRCDTKFTQFEWRRYILRYLFFYQFRPIVIFWLAESTPNHIYIWIFRWEKENNEIFFKFISMEVYEIILLIM